MIILQKDIRPQRLFARVNANMSTEKVQREGRHYLSSDMIEVREWCKRHGLSYSFDFFHEKGRPFLDDNMLGVVGDDVDMSDFPLRYTAVEVLK